MNYFQHQLVTLLARHRKPKAVKTPRAQRFGKYDDGTDAEFLTHAAAARDDME